MLKDSVGNQKNNRVNTTIQNQLKCEFHEKGELLFKQSMARRHTGGMHQIVYKSGEGNMKRSLNMETCLWGTEWDQHPLLLDYYTFFK